MSGRRVLATLAAGAAGCLLVCAASRSAHAPRLLWNTTASAPIGFYLVTPGHYAKGELAAVRPPPGLARWMAIRGYLPLNVPLLKEVAAVEGQRVCGQGGALFIDGRLAARMKPADRHGRKLTAYSGCRRLRADEVFLLNPDASNSLDSRYFGPISRRQVIGQARPAWTWSPAK
ncbi:peptidase [Caulobacter flavus]|uniref:Peptidase n=1 Tax=Caulobacter flavus TaxID=1679497 RepID=A0A2N5CP20_9CAUL|nr:S26 family signal peptidase [Caulobacter flavus]AYV48606.1 peptidase [Caulobacter flavus]PLR08678.1 peptidase [Caulobacter flavus]